MQKAKSDISDPAFRWRTSVLASVPLIPSPRNLDEWRGRLRRHTNCFWHLMLVLSSLWLQSDASLLLPSSVNLVVVSEDSAKAGGPCCFRKLGLPGTPCGNLDQIMIYYAKSGMGTRYDPKTKQARMVGACQPLGIP